MAKVESRNIVKVEDPVIIDQVSLLMMTCYILLTQNTGIMKICGKAKPVCSNFGLITVFAKKVSIV